ncbi:hypothetical protein PIB30_072855 [Stylosanthes scabra]|uniref:Uncharacterized protein n=1 Tax=Stylosanthes scabra TaxID=79078 RepID=A0ABU6YN58_9FABA|nr:hypothetical protein [Stylosanthes scabra]
MQRRTDDDDVRIAQREGQIGYRQADRRLDGRLLATPTAAEFRDVRTGRPEGELGNREGRSTAGRTTTGDTDGGRAP